MGGRMGPFPRDNGPVPGVLGMDERNPIESVGEVLRRHPKLLRTFWSPIEIMIVLRCPVRGPLIDYLGRQVTSERHYPLRQRWPRLLHRNAHLFVLFERQWLGWLENAVLVDSFDSDSHAPASENN